MKQIILKVGNFCTEIRIYIYISDIESANFTLYVRSEKRPTMTTKKGMLSQCISEFCKLNIEDVHSYVMDTVESNVGRRYNEEVGTSVMITSLSYHYHSLLSFAGACGGCCCGSN